jgi:hypothetical protein
MPSGYSAGPTPVPHHAHFYKAPEVQARATRRDGEQDIRLPGACRPPALSTVDNRRPQHDMSRLSPRVKGSRRLTSAGDKGGVGAATFRAAPRPPALRRHRVRTRTGSMMDWVPGARLLASRDAGLLPVPRLPRSRLTLAWANDQRTIPGGHSRSDRGSSDPVHRALTQA